MGVVRGKEKRRVLAGMAQKRRVLAGRGWRW
jgi:hypothetical protein